MISNLGRTPNKLSKSALESGTGRIVIPEYVRRQEEKQLVGVDVFLDWQGTDPDELGDALAKLDAYKLKLKMITNRGVKVYPQGLKETYCTDHWRCRFVGIGARTGNMMPKYDAIDFEQVIALLSRLSSLDYDVIKTENLYEFNGARCFSLGQGE